MLFYGRSHAGNEWNGIVRHCFFPLAGHGPPHNFHYRRTSDTTIKQFLTSNGIPYVSKPFDRNLLEERLNSIWVKRNRPFDSGK
jgi:hypothetical protein